MRAREKTIEDGVGNGRFAEVLVPERDRELARDDGGTQPSAILDDFEQICGGLIGERLNGEVVEHEHISSRPGPHQSRQPAIGPPSGDLRDQAWRPDIESAVCPARMADNARAQAMYVLPTPVGPTTITP